MTRGLALALLFAGCSPPGPADAGGGTEDAGVDAGRGDGGSAAPIPGCVEDNAAASVAARDGFTEWCADAGTLAQCGDGSALKLTWRESPDGGAALFLYFRDNGRCADYLGCWGRDGRGGDDRTVAGLTNAERTAPRVSSFGQVAHGLFNGGEPGNALAGFAAVHAADCTGDLGIADEVVDYPRPVVSTLDAPASVRTHRRGARNVDAAVALAKQKFPAAARIVLGGTGSGAYFALAALPKVNAAWPGVPLTVLFDGEAGVGDPALGSKFAAALSGFDGQGGRPLARFVAVGFATDPVQQRAAPAGYNTALAFWPAQEATYRAREASAPSSFRWFSPALDCHAVALSPGLWSKYVPWTGGLRPAQPAQRPNLDLAVDGGVLEPWLFSALSGTGTFDSSFSSVGADIDAGTKDCTLPDSFEP